MSNNLDVVGLDDTYVIKQLYKLIFEAETKIGKSNEISYPNFTAMLRGIKIRRDIKGYGQGKISLEDLFGLSADVNKTKLYFLMDKEGLDDISIFKHLKYIMDSGYKLILRKGSAVPIEVEDDYVKLTAVKERSVLKGYLSTDELSVLKFFKVEDGRMQKILSINVN